jgi:hypothetical protein
MIRIILAGIALALVAVPASANFGIFRRQVEVVGASYYYIPPVYRMPPVVCEPLAQPSAHPFPVRPQMVQPPVGPVKPGVPSQAMQEAAPASGAEPPVPRKMSPAESTENSSNKVETPYFEVYSNANGKRTVDRQRKTVQFWNLSRSEVTLRLDGRQHVLAANTSESFDVPGEFAWQVAGREPEVGRIQAGDPGVTIVIRR